MKAKSQTQVARAAAYWPLALLLAVFLAVVFAMPLTAPFFHWLFPDVLHPVYVRASFFELTVAHCELVFVSTFAAACIGIGTGVYVTRDKGREFLPLAGALAAIGQTFPPVAVLALAIPLLGYGAAPTLVALVLYSTLPILEATIAGLYAVPHAARDAGVGLGFSPKGLLWHIELPLAAPFIFAGLRNAAIVNIGTATIGSSVGALSLGSPILEGLSASNPAYVLQGALIVSLLAVLVDRAFETLEQTLNGQTLN
jgi:osmoprotectant transport system permease protein